MKPEPPTASGEPPALCPTCGYDLRGHADPTTCPECGAHAAVSAARIGARIGAVRWIDTRLLDLWSIALLQAVGTLSSFVGLAATRAGQYVALVLGLVGLVYTACATVWFVACAIGFALRAGQPAMQMVAPDHRARLTRWMLIDVCIVLGSLAATTSWLSLSF